MAAIAGPKRLLRFTGGGPTVALLHCRNGEFRWPQTCRMCTEPCTCCWSNLWQPASCLPKRLAL